ncbi:TPA: 16S rRNA (cytosine(1402)-N(4))-methyltransferase [Patescibacteria group bacterium]|nr:16S rRNA (cytosine(1402)-N(4))-methyltransferase [Patescibacteria group bacterium]
MDKVHIPVLLDKSLESLSIKPDRFYIDCTLGDGGHSYKILSRLSSQGLLLSIDQDQHAIDFVKEYYQIPSNWILAYGNFSKLLQILKENNIDKQPDGILMDLGLSSRQLEKSHNRGFSYSKESEPLDMRMDTKLGVTALDMLKALSEKELAKLFTIYGEEHFAKPIARKIKQNISEINSVGDLTRLIYGAVPATPNHKNPSRRVFQALRIAVNDELNSLKKGLDSSFKILSTNGRVSVITFHSLEDRIVKRFFDKQVKEGKGILLFNKLYLPTKQELEKNPRASSAKLRTLIKI